MHVLSIEGPTQIHLSGFLLQLFLCTVSNLGLLSLCHNSHINNFVRVLILWNLDVFGLVPLGVLGHVVDLPRGDVSFLCAIFLMVWYSSIPSTTLPCDRRAAQLPIMITSV